VLEVVNTVCAVHTPRLHEDITQKMQCGSYQLNTHFFGVHWAI